MDEASAFGGAQPVCLAAMDPWKRFLYDLGDARSGWYACSHIAVAISTLVHAHGWVVRVSPKAAREVAKRSPGVSISVFSDRDLGPQRAKVEAALASADVFFGSLLFDFDQVPFAKSPVQRLTRSGELLSFLRITCVLLWSCEPCRCKSGGE